MLSILIFFFSPLYGEGYEAINEVLNGNSAHYYLTAVSLCFWATQSYLFLYIILIIIFKILFRCHQWSWRSRVVFLCPHYLWGV